MSFEQVVKVPIDRLGALIGKAGSTKKRFEEACSVVIAVDGKTGTVTVKSGSPERGDPFKAVRIIEAVGRGFSPQRAAKLLEDDSILEVIDIRDYAGKSESSLQRMRGRVIGLHGKSRRVMEELTDCYVSVYGRTVSIIGSTSEVRLASEAVRMLASGSPHRTVYNMLQKARTKKKMERLMLWQDESLEFEAHG